MYVRLNLGKTISIVDDKKKTVCLTEEQAHQLFESLERYFKIHPDGCEFEDQLATKRLQEKNCDCNCGIGVSWTNCPESTSYCG